MESEVEGREPYSTLGPFSRGYKVKKKQKVVGYGEVDKANLHEHKNDEDGWFDPDFYALIPHEGTGTPTARWIG